VPLKTCTGQAALPGLTACVTSGTRSRAGRAPPRTRAPPRRPGSRPAHTPSGQVDDPPVERAPVLVGEREAVADAQQARDRARQALVDQVRRRPPVRQQHVVLDQPHPPVEHHAASEPPPLVLLRHVPEGSDPSPRSDLRCIFHGAHVNHSAVNDGDELRRLRVLVGQASREVLARLLCVGHGVHRRVQKAVWTCPFSRRRCTRARRLVNIGQTAYDNTNLLLVLCWKSRYGPTPSQGGTDKGDRMSKIKTRGLASAGITAAIILGSATGALAASGPFGNLSASGVAFVNNYVTFHPSSVARGGMEYTGTLQDTASDGHNVFVHGKVEGYGYGPRLYSPGYKDQNLYDPSATYVNTGSVQACTDRGTFGADSCASTGTLRR